MVLFVKLEARPRNTELLNAYANSSYSARCVRGQRQDAYAGREMSGPSPKTAKLQQVGDGVHQGINTREPQQGYDWHWFAVRPNRVLQ